MRTCGLVTIRLQKSNSSSKTSRKLRCQKLRRFWILWQDSLSTHLHHPTRACWSKCSRKRKKKLKPHIEDRLLISRKVLQLLQKTYKMRVLNRRTQVKIQKSLNWPTKPLIETGSLQRHKEIRKLKQRPTESFKSRQNCKRRQTGYMTTLGLSLEKTLNKPSNKDRNSNRWKRKYRMKETNRRRKV